MKKVTAILTLCAVSALSAGATVNPTDFPDLELGKEYTLEMYKTFRGKYTPTDNGQIIEYGAVPVYILQNGELSNLTSDDGYKYAGYINGKQAYQFSVTAGVTYFFYDDFVMDNGVFSIELNPEIKMTESFPEIGAVYDPADNSFIELAFNQNITIGKATVKIGTLSANVETIVSGANVSIMLNDVLHQWYNEDKIKGGEELVVTLSSIKDGLGNAVTDLTYSFKTANKPVELVDYSLPVELLSWYNGDEAAKAIFTFSGALAQNPNVELCYAPVELGYEYTEKLNAQVDGNTLIVDFGGVRRTAAEMSTSGRNDAQIYLLLMSLKDANGQTVWSDGQGTVGSFMYEIPFAEIPRLNITSEFNPSTGSSLETAKTVNIYFNCADHLTYSGVSFTSGSDKAVVCLDAITVDRISDSEVELIVPIPAGWNDKQNVIISLEGLTSDDGYDHSSEISAKYNGFTLIYCSIKNGARMKSLSKGSIVKVETNLGDDASLSLSISDLFGPVDMTPSGDGVFMLTMPETVVFEKDEIYTVEFIATPGGTETITIIGDTTPYEYSDLELASVSPEDGSYIVPDAEIQLTFTGLVAISAAEGSIPFAAIPENDSETPGFDYKWTLKLENVSDDGIATLAFTATDQDGKILKGNMGVDADSYFTLTFTVTSAGISVVETSSDASAFFDLQGRRVVTPKSGIYIHNGKKIKL